MKLLVDAHLPRKLAHQFSAAGHDVLHTFDLPAGNSTSDQYINAITARDQRIVITKDSDFVNSFWLQKQPWKLLLVSTGNINNAELISLFIANLKSIEAGFSEFHFIELTRNNLIFHA